MHFWVILSNLLKSQHDNCNQRVALLLEQFLLSSGCVSFGTVMSIGTFHCSNHFRSLYCVRWAQVFFFFSKFSLRKSAATFVQSTDSCPTAAMVTFQSDCTASWENRWQKHLYFWRRTLQKRLKREKCWQRSAEGREERRNEARSGNRQRINDCKAVRWMDFRWRKTAFDICSTGVIVENE